ncbi:hypothetical protein [Hydrogenimonas sp.]
MKTEKRTTEAANVTNLQRYSSRIDTTIERAKRDIVDQAKRYRNNGVASQTGFVAESVHVGSFNIDSAIKRSTLEAVREKNGCHGDFKVLDRGKRVLEGEFKHYATAERTENAMRGYGERVLVGPKEQVKDIEKIAGRKALKNRDTRPRVSEEHRNVQRNVDDAIRKDGVKSRPRTLKEQKRIAKKAQNGRVDTADLLPDFSESLKNGAVSGALDGARTGAVFGGVFSTAINVKEVFDGKKSVGEASVEIVRETAVSAADAAVKNAAGSAAKVASTHFAEKVANQTAKKVLGSAAPVIAAVTAVEIGKDVCKYVSGDIDGETLAKNSGKTVAASAAAWGGAEAGAVMGAAVGGPVGAAVGAVVGGIVASLGVSSLFD